MVLSSLLDCLIYRLHPISREKRKKVSREFIIFLFLFAIIVAYLSWLRKKNYILQKIGAE